MPFAATWIKLRDDHTKYCKLDKDKCHMISLIHEILKNYKNELICKIETDSQTSKTNLWQLKGKSGWSGLGV